MYLAAGYGAGIDKIRLHISDTGLTFVSGIDISANIEVACEKNILGFVQNYLRIAREFRGGKWSKSMQSFNSGKRAFAIVEMRKDIVC
ncbi:hypothetical protein [Francisella salina]|uniref:Uncharacterized protein n=1 Tax=Francisella salina TaxID=573569 RepID=A0ABM5M986_FRAST|nr:hypothetical protein [Francisella salina]AEI35680.1 hypothetical protein F7308_0753 [Francisella salina]